MVMAMANKRWGDACDGAKVWLMVVMVDNDFELEHALNMVSSMV